MNRRNLLIATLAFALHVGETHADAAPDDVAVIVNKTNGVPPMNRSQLSALFRAKTTQFPGGGRATALNLPPDNPARQAFDAAVLGMQPDEVERFWLDSKIRSGVGSPRKLAGPAVMVHVVSTDETGLGYVPSTDVGPGVRVVARIRSGQVLAPERAREGATVDARKLGVPLEFGRKDDEVEMSKKIIVIDDSQTIREQVTTTLRQAGFDVFEAVDGVDGGEVIERTLDAALVICDVNMPKKNGIELLESLKKDERFGALPVIMLTSEGRPQLIERARKAGAKGWLVKPVKADLLLATVRKLTS
jgi:two-component system, chemotaxis family, chemotaxis protein CheY